MEQFKKFEDQFISSYETVLAEEGKEICKEVDSIIGNYDELMVEKANTYCMFISHPKRPELDPKLVNRCKKYLLDTSNYRRLKIAFEEIAYSRKMG